MTGRVNVAQIGRIRRHRFTRRASRSAALTIPGGASVVEAARRLSESLIIKKRAVLIDPERSAFVSEFVEPVGKRVLVRKDESRQKTRGGIVLPDAAEIPTITGRVVEVSVRVARDEDFPIRKYDKILFHPKNAIPVDFEPDNLLFVVPIEDVVAVFRPARKKAPASGSQDESLGDDEIRETDGLEQD
jgi:chaperonin GroES